MEAKLITSELDCFKRTYFTKLKKEESRDCVVPDTMPDVAEVLGCWGALLIRSKDIAPGRIRIEANIPAGVLCRGEDGSLRIVKVSVPVFISSDSESISEGAAATAKLKLLSLEARTLNPRKILVSAEISAEISAYEDEKFCWTENSGEEEHIHSHVAVRSVSPITAVAEKTFALTDEISIPDAVADADSFCLAGCECIVDDIRAVGSKLVAKGRIKSRLVALCGGKDLCHYEPVTDFSQIIELKQEAGTGVCSLWLTPSGAYCSRSSDKNGTLVLEYHMVAQLVCRRDKQLQYVDEVYSNQYSLETEFSECRCEFAASLPPQRESSRQLFETLRPVETVLFAQYIMGDAVFEGEKMLIPLKVNAVCAGGGEIWREKCGFDISFRIPKLSGEMSCLGAELTDTQLLPVPGGMELRLDSLAIPACCSTDNMSYVSNISWAEDKPLDKTEKPSLVILRIKEGMKLWELARENCSSVEAILSANGISDADEAVGKLILIPKTL